MKFEEASFTMKRGGSFISSQRSQKFDDIQNLWLQEERSIIFLKKN